jgi:hypothetical protein
MSEHPIDRLFREGLSEHSISPSVGAWEKVLQRQQAAAATPKSYRWLYMMAASISLIVVALLSFWPANPSNTEHTLSALRIDGSTSIAAENTLRLPDTSLGKRSMEAPNQQVAPETHTKTSKETPTVVERPVVEQIAKLRPLPFNRLELQLLDNEWEETRLALVEMGKIALPEAEQYEEVGMKFELAELTRWQQMVARLRKEINEPTFSLGDLREAKDELFARNILFNPEKSKLYEY